MTWGLMEPMKHRTFRKVFQTFDSWVLENTLNYDRTFGKHTVSGMVGYSAQKDKSYGLNGSNSDLPKFIDTMTGNVTTMKSSSSIHEQALVSLFGRVMYSYDDRYLFSASIRRDGSSRFKDGHRFGSFPQSLWDGTSTVKSSSARWKTSSTK